MTTNQEGRQAAIRDSTSTAYGVAADWNALFDDAGISAGTFNERLLAWINDQLGTSYSNLLGAMAAYAADAGFNAWSSISTLVLGGASTLLSGETDGLAFDFTDSSARIKDTSTPANEYSSTGIVSSGELVGPSGKLTYTSPSKKLTLQSDGVMRYQAHNLILQSEDLTAATGSWTETNVSTVANSGGATPPANYAAITSIANNATAGAHSVLKAVTAVAGAPYALEVVAKYNDNQYLGLSINNSSNANEWAAARFDLINGTVAATNNNGSSAVVVSTSIEDISGGWYKCRLVGSQTSTTIWALVSVENDSTTFTTSLRGRGSYSGSGELIYISGAHVYRYPANTDYIRTTSAAKYALPLEYSATDGSCLGLLVEEARTNLCLYSNDLTQAGSWTASNMTTAKTATGPDNVANSATTITASAGNATILQAITSASAARVTSVYIKRRTGTGNIDLTQDNGSTWTTQAVDSTWTRFSLSSVTSANPTVGIRIVTSGDAVDVALFSHEVGALVTSPILTYGAAATRNADPLSQLTSTFPLSATAGSFYAYVAPYAGADLAGIVSLNDGAGNEEIVIYKDASANIVAQVEDGGVNQLAPLDSTVNASSGTAFKVALAWAANDFALSADGTAAQTDTGGTLPTVTTLEIGVDQANNYFNGHIKAISYVPRRKSNAELQAETT